MTNLSFGTRRSGIASSIVLAGLLLVGAKQAPVLQIDYVSPQTAPVGAKVTVALTRPITQATVHFGGQEATIESAAAGVFYVVVPKGLAPGERPPVIVRSSAGDATFLKFEVADEIRIVKNAPIASLTIISVTPQRAPPGATVRVKLSRPLRAGATAVYFGDSRASVNGSGLSLNATVPDLEPGDHSVVVVEGDAGTRPVPFTVSQRTIFGIDPSSIPWTLIWVALTLGVATTAYITNRSRARYERIEKQYETIRTFNRTGTDEVDPSVPRAPTALAEVPRDLIEICASRNALLFAGPGLGAQARLPTRYEALVHLINASDFDESLKLQLGAALRGGQLAFVTEVLGSRIGRSTLIAELQRLYADDNVPISAAHRRLQAIPFAGVLTTAWDGLVEKTFEKRQPIVLTGEADIELAHRQDAFFIARLNGDLYVPESFVFSSEEYRRTLYDRPTYAKFVASQVLTRPLFFVGMALSGIEDFFDAFRFPVRSSVGNSYAILPFSTLWEAQQERFRAKYNVELIGYQPTPGHGELVQFLMNLQRAVSAAVPPEAVTAAEAQISAAKLRRVELTNIGAFEHLVLDDLQNSWNVLLGNNGAGKSTILRAIALGICGDDPEAIVHARRLLRNGARDGRIELQVGEVIYRTELVREGDRITVRCGQLTPLQKGNWVVLGFPPLRGVSTSDPVGPSSGDARQPRVTDLLPLIDGKTDTRLDSLKQWLVNLYITANMTNDVTKSEARRAQRTSEAFYSVLRAFTPGQMILAGQIEHKSTSWNVNVQTEDGEVPIDNVSQGMSSIFGWVGTLLQRMHEIYPDSEHPTAEPALVLVDEIDAHLHPEWQQKLTAIVKEHLPNVQMIATTHSPLLVAGMKQKELVIAMRDPVDRSKVTVSPSIVNPEGLRADQILTTPLFGLQSSRSPEVNIKVNRYALLLGNESRDADEEQEFAELKQELASMLLFGETEVERVAERQATARSKNRIAELVAEVATASDATKERLRREL